MLSIVTEGYDDQTCAFGDENGDPRLAGYQCRVNQRSGCPEPAHQGHGAGAVIGRDGRTSSPDIAGDPGPQRATPGRLPAQSAVRCQLVDFQKLLNCLVLTGVGQG